MRAGGPTGYGWGVACSRLVYPCQRAAPGHHLNDGERAALLWCTAYADEVQPLTDVWWCVRESGHLPSSAGPVQTERMSSVAGSSITNSHCASMIAGCSAEVSVTSAEGPAQTVGLHRRPRTRARVAVSRRAVRPRGPRTEVHQLAVLVIDDGEEPLGGIAYCAYRPPSMIVEFNSMSVGPTEGGRQRRRAQARRVLRHQVNAAGPPTAGTFASVAGGPRIADWSRDDDRWERPRCHPL
jgi:hypothetical protein